MADPTKPKLVAKPVDPAKLAARVVEPAPPVPDVRPSATGGPADSPIELVTVPTRKRPVRATTPFLGWLVLGVLLLLTTGAVGALIWFRDEPWLTFQSSPIPSVDSKSDLRANRQTQPSQAPPPANSEPISPIQPRATELHTDAPAPLVPASPSRDQEIETAAESQPAREVEILTGPTSSTPPVVAADAPVVAADAPVVDSVPHVVALDPEVSSSESDLFVGQRVVVLRLLDLALLGIAAGKPEMAESCLQQATQISEESGLCDVAVSLTQQLVTWQQEINSTVTARVPLLTNREEMAVDDTIVSLISASDRGLIIRAAGQRREYEADKLPWSLVRSVLEVTNSDNSSEDLARKIVTDVLRRRDLSEEANQARANALRGLLAAEWQSSAYPTPAIQLLLVYLDANADLAKLGVGSDAARPIPVAESSKLYREAAGDLRTNRELLGKMQDKAVKRFELEAWLWSQTDTAKLESIARTILLLQHSALEQQDLAASLDHLFRTELLITLTPDHPMWADVTRSILKSKPSDSDLLPLLNQLRSATNDPRYGAQARNGLSQVGKQLAQRLTDRTQKQAWIKNF